MPRLAEEIKEKIAYQILVKIERHQRPDKLFNVSYNILGIRFSSEENSGKRMSESCWVCGAIRS